MAADGRSGGCERHVAVIPKLIDDDPCVAPTVMAGRGAATHVFWPTPTRKTWMAGPRPAMTVGSMSRCQRALVSGISTAFGFAMMQRILTAFYGFDGSHNYAGSL
jgi:hypothetical protein